MTSTGKNGAQNTKDGLGFCVDLRQLIVWVGIGCNGPTDTHGQPLPFRGRGVEDGAENGDRKVCGAVWER